MIPEVCPSKATVGEKRLFAILSRVLPEDYSVWYEPSVNSRHPDFLVLGGSFGLLTLEVKGWYAGQIKRASDGDVDLEKREGEKAFVQTLRNPILQAREYMFRTMDALVAEPLLRNPDGRHQGKLCFPCGYGVVFNNITRDGLDAVGLSEVFPPAKALCRDDLDALESATPEAALGTLKRLFAVQFPFKELTHDQFRTIQGTIYKEVMVKPRAPTARSVPQGQAIPAGARVLDVLDPDQELAARSVGAGHRLLVGVAGAGKTVVLIARARMLAGEGAGRKILFLCYNSSFAAYVNSKLHEARNVHVLTFRKWAEARSGVPRWDRERETFEEYEERLGLAMLRASEGWREAERYDAVLVDEAIDFQPDWIRCCVRALKDREAGDLLVAVDGAQSIYGRDSSFTWKSVGVNAVGRTKELRVNFRNTAEIITFAWLVAQGKERDGEGTEAHARVWPKSAKRQGPKPSYRACAGTGEERAVVARAVQHFKSLGVAESEIAVLYPRAVGDRINELYRFLGEGSVCWMTNDKDWKARHEFMARPGVRLCTIHSAKGLEFQAVVFACLDQLPSPLSGDEAADANLMYVGLTRATEHLLVTWSGRSAFTDRVEQSSKATVFDLC
jgi:hypothetical protein